MVVVCYSTFELLRGAETLHHPGIQSHSVGCENPESSLYLDSHPANDSWRGGSQSGIDWSIDHAESVEKGNDPGYSHPARSPHPDGDGDGWQPTDGRYSGQRLWYDRSSAKNHSSRSCNYTCINSRRPASSSPLQRSAGHAGIYRRNGLLFNQ